MATVSKHGQMVQDMKENGATTKQMDKESFGTLMAIFMRANGKTIKLRDMVFINIKMEQDMKVIGRKISKMVLE